MLKKDLEEAIESISESFREGKIEGENSIIEMIIQLLRLDDRYELKKK